MAKQRTFKSEFKARVVLRALSGEKSIARIGLFLVPPETGMSKSRLAGTKESGKKRLVKRNHLSRGRGMVFPRFLKHLKVSGM
ncbi:MAG: hypothetical protein ACKV2V_30685 [Blastocatellia bacterium]